MCEKYEEDKQNTKVCENCKHIQRPYRKEINDTVYFKKILKFVELNNLCPNWGKFGKE